MMIATLYFEVAVKMLKLSQVLITLNTTENFFYIFSIASKVYRQRIPPIFGVL